jgi:hypothetical protein
MYGTYGGKWDAGKKVKNLISDRVGNDDSHAHPPHQQSDAYADPEYSWDDYMQS